jgi:hypothetical protein
MRINRSLVFASALFFFGVSAAVAGPIKHVDRGASNNGVADLFAACSNPTNPDNCGDFATTSTAGPDGTTITQFVTNSGDFMDSGPGTVVLADVFVIPDAIVAGDVLTLNFTAADNDFGIFACDDGTGQPVVPGPHGVGTVTLTGPCTLGPLTTLQGLANLTALTSTSLGASATFTFAGSGIPPSWAFYSDPGGFTGFTLTTPGGGGGGTNPTPEPGSASLLFAGALAASLVALKARR